MKEILWIETPTDSNAHTERGRLEVFQNMGRTWTAVMYGDKERKHPDHFHPRATCRIGSYSTREKAKYEAEEYIKAFDD